MFLKILWNFYDGPVVKNLPSSAGDSGPISGQRTKIPHATGLELSPCAATSEPTHQNHRVCRQQLRPNAAKIDKNFLIKKIKIDQRINIIKRKQNEVVLFLAANFYSNTC